MADRYEQVLPIEWREGYRAARQNRDRLALSSELAVLTRLIEAALAQLSPVEPMDPELVEMAEDYATTQPGERLRIADAIVERILNGGSSNREAMKVVGLIEQKRKLAATEARRIREEETRFNLRQAHLLVTAVLECVQRNVTDDETRTRVGAELKALLPKAN